MIKQVRIMCPGNNASGGPELLHQFAAELRANRVDAAMCYYPFDKPATIRDRYSRYAVPSVVFEDRRDTIFIIPETATYLREKIKLAKIAIWWLSVDNYFGRLGNSQMADFIMKYRLLLSSRTPINRLRGLSHYAQSKYALDFLDGIGIKAKMLSDYLSAEHLVASYDDSKRRDIILINPKKGVARTKRLRESLPEFEFVEIKNLTPSEVKSLMQSAKIYLDFGQHPGKDRLPREAALAGCCIITNRRGSAANELDVPIPDRFKLIDTFPEVSTTFRTLASSIFLDFKSFSSDFYSYRESIRSEYSLFKDQVKRNFIDDLQIEACLPLPAPLTQHFNLGSGEAL